MKTLYFMEFPCDTGLRMDGVFRPKTSPGDQGMTNRRTVLNWHADRSRLGGGRWEKMYKGRVFYYSAVDGKSDRLGHERALEAFARWKTDQDTKRAADKPYATAYASAIKMRVEMLNWLRLEPARLATEQQLQALYDRLTGEVKRLQSNFAKVSPPAINQVAEVEIDPDALWDFPLVGMTATEATEWLGQLECLRAYQRWTSSPDNKGTVKAKCDEYVLGKRTLVQSGQIKVGTYKAIANRIPHFARFAGDMDASRIDEKILSAFRDDVLRRIANGMKPQYGKNIVDAAKAFVRQLWRQRVLEHFPRNLDDLTIRLEHTAIKTFDAGEIKTIFEAASERTRLYLLLMLNCGFYQSDIAALKRSEFDEGGRRITRKRSKTGHLSINVPLVSWRLWDETHRLLVKFGQVAPHSDRAKGPHAGKVQSVPRSGTDQANSNSNHGPNANGSGCLLLNENGRPVYRRALRTDGDVADCDNIKSAYERVCRKLDIKPKPLMLLRKTAASKLEEHDTYGRFAQLFLGQAPQALAERRYARPSPEQFDKAVQWLGEQFGYATTKGASVPSATT
jgi:integrase